MHRWEVTISLASITQFTPVWSSFGGLLVAGGGVHIYSNETSAP